MRAAALTGLAAGLPVSFAAARANGLDVAVQPFGKMPDATEVQMYTLTNANGMEVSVLTYGGIVQSIKVPDKNGHIEDVALGFDNLSDYREKSPYFGAVIGHTRTGSPKVDSR